MKSFSKRDNDSQKGMRGCEPAKDLVGREPEGVILKAEECESLRSSRRWSSRCD